jgi:hypothetical protein
MSQYQSQNKVVMDSSNKCGDITRNGGFVWLEGLGGIGANRSGALRPRTPTIRNSDLDNERQAKHRFRSLGMLPSKHRRCAKSSPAKRKQP